MERTVDEDGSHCCLVAIGRLQVTSTPNTSDLAGTNSNAGKDMQWLWTKISVLWMIPY